MVYLGIICISLLHFICLGISIKMWANIERLEG